jgi:L-ascorbate metabolism protein UlaG (beta-lactamase superfamily)
MKMEWSAMGKPRTTRRWWIAGAGMGTLGAAAAGAYLAAPPFWQQFRRDLGRPVLPPPQIPDPSKWPDRGLFAAWLGHSSVLLKLDGYTILTDPVLFHRVGLDFRLFTIGLKRLIGPALDARGLPKIDLVLLSHAHMDHLDIPSLRTLESRGTQVITASSTSDLLRAHKWRAVRELRWGDRVRAGEAEVHAFEVNHWGARMRTDRWRGYNGYVVDTGKRRILFGGDTALTDSFRALRTRRGVDLAIMPIGAYNPWIRVHCTPEQAWKMGSDAGAEFFLPVHHQTFALSREPKTEPIERFVAAAGSSQDRVAVHSIGGEFRLA